MVFTNNTERISSLIALAIGMLAAVNTLHFASVAATPLIQADGWYFMDHFVAKYLDGTLGWLDLFMQRGVGDHAQPLQKLILLWHTRYFGMDFRLEGLVGAGFAVLFCLLVVLSAERDVRQDVSTSILRGVILGMVFVAGLSLNAINIYTWPLVTLGYIGFALAILYVLVLCHGGSKSSFLMPAILTFVLGMLADELAIVFVTAFLLSFAVFGVSTRSNVVKMTCGILLGLALARLLMSWIGRQQGVDSSAVDNSQSITLFLNGGAVGIVDFARIPVTDGLIHQEHFKDGKYWSLPLNFFFLASLGAQLFTLMMLGVLRLKGNRGRQLLVVLFLLLTSYAITAGLILNRVGTFGVDYLHQPRYVAVFQLPWMGFFLLLHYLARLRIAAGYSVARALVFGASVVLFAGLQISLSNEAWKMPPYLSEYWHNASRKMEEIRTNPNSNVSNCPDIIVPCTYPTADRLKALDFLAKHRLNLYSATFQARHDLHPTAPSH